MIDYWQTDVLLPFSSFLFESPFSVSLLDLYLHAGLLGLVALLFILLSRIVHCLSVDFMFSRTIGLPVYGINAVILLLFTLSLLIASKTNGFLLSCGLLIFPGLCARQLAHRWFTMALSSVLVALISSCSGILISICDPNLPASIFILSIMIALYILLSVVSAVESRRTVVEH